MAAVRLVTEERADEGPAVLVLHGFTGAARALRPLIDAGLCGRLIIPDLVGHGASPAPATTAAYRVDAQLQQLLDVLARLQAPDVHLVGYSMGARLALSFAVAHPSRVRSLALIGGRAGIADPEARAARIHADDALAARIEDGGVPAFARWWADRPIFASQRRLSPATRGAQQAIRRAQRAGGLAGSLRGFGAGAMPPLHDRLSGLFTPTALITGGLDLRFTAIAAQMASTLPDCSTHQLPDAGHATHLEAPAATVHHIHALWDRTHGALPPAG